MSDALLRASSPHVHHVEGFHDAIRQALPNRGRVSSRLRRAPIWSSIARASMGTDFQAHPDLQHPDWFRLLGKMGTIPFADGHFDAISAVMVLEHVADPRAFLSEVTRVLRPGGRFIGHTISGSHYVTFIRRLIGLLPHAVNQALVKRLYGRAEVDTFPAFYRLNTEGRVRRFCGAAGLELVRVRRYADPGYFRFAKPLETAAILADRVLDGICSGWGRLYLTITIEKPCATNQSLCAA